MISETAFTQCLMACGITPVCYPDRTRWKVAGEDHPFDLRSPVLVPVASQWLQSQVTSMGVEAEERYNHIALRIDPTAIQTGLHWQGAVGRMVCSMVALDLWDEEYALMVLGIQRTKPEEDDGTQSNATAA